MPSVPLPGALVTIRLPPVTLSFLPSAPTLNPTHVLLAKSEPTAMVSRLLLQGYGGAESVGVR
jgi:hypothetical protein